MHHHVDDFGSTVVSRHFEVKLKSSIYWYEHKAQRGRLDAIHLQVEANACGWNSLPKTRIELDGSHRGIVNSIHQVHNCAVQKEPATKDGQGHQSLS